MKEEILHLENLGLNKTEANVYLALQELGEAKTGDICNKLNMPNSHIYRILDSLMKKGLASYKLANKIKIFKATDPRALELIYKEKQKVLKEKENSVIKLIDNLKKIPKKKETASDYEYFEGFSGLMAMWDEFYKDLEPNTKMCLYASTIENWEKLNEVYLEHHKLRSKKGVKLNMIIPKGESKSIFKKSIEERKKLGNITIKTNDTKNEAEFAIYGDNLLIQETTKDTKIPRGFLIKDPIFAKSFEIFFEMMWKNSTLVN